MEKNSLRIALAGNPNSGKTTLFNALTGAHHQVGNYPGVTVETREGARTRNGRNGGRSYHFTDLPGIYSLTAYSEDEVVSRDFILDEKPDLIIDVLDSTNIERNLYLCLQMQELGIPVVGALNMSDEAEARGIRIDEKQLSAALGIDFVKITAIKGRGIDDLLDIVDASYTKAQNAYKDGSKTSLMTLSYGAEIDPWLQKIEDLIIKGEKSEKKAVESNRVKAEAHFLAAKLLEKDQAAPARLDNNANRKDVLAMARDGITWVEKHYGKDSEIVISEQRYAYIHGAVKETVDTIKKTNFSLTENIDKVIMNHFLALPIFIGILWIVFQLTFTIGAYPQGWLQSFFDFISDFLNSNMEAGPLRSLLVDGIIAGVGSVFSFVPLIVLLFFFLSILEDVGYMSRAAFATDKLLHSFGLHGQSVFPLMLGFGCSVPAIMASRTLKSARDRIVTVLVTPMMSCGAKLTIHVLFAAAFFPNNAANMVMLIYACGVVIGLISSMLLKSTILKGDPTPLVMELPPYRMPTLGGALWHVWEKLGGYIKKAGTIILACAILIWVMTNYPNYQLPDSQLEQLKISYLAENPDAGGDDVDAYIETMRADARLEHSAAGTLGHVIEPVFKPLGFNWKMSVAAITGFAAKEVVVSTLGILYHVGIDEEGDSKGLRDAVKSDMSPLNAFTFMLFMLLIPPCIAALSVIKAELGWKWLGFETLFLLVLGWLVSFIVFQAGSLIH
jgi:ferrous iron transport protein B